MEPTPLAIAACTSSLKLLDGFQLNLMAGPTLKIVGENFAMDYIGLPL